MVEYNWMTKEQKIQEAVSDLYWELDRMSTSGQETLNKLAKKYNDIQWEEEVVYGTKMLVSEPLAMSYAAGWYIGQLCKEDDFPMPFDRFTEYMSKEDALKLLKEDIF